VENLGLAAHPMRNRECVHASCTKLSLPVQPSWVYGLQSFHASVKIVLLWRFVTCLSVSHEAKEASRGRAQACAVDGLASKSTNGVQGCEEAACSMQRANSSPDSLSHTLCSVCLLIRLKAHAGRHLHEYGACARLQDLLAGSRSVTAMVGCLQEMNAVKQLGDSMLPDVSAAATAAHASLRDLRTMVLSLQLVVEGCKASVPADQCKASTSLSELNACIYDVGSGKVTAHGLGQGIVVEQGVTTPTCNSTHVCPCCLECATSVAAIDKIAAMLPTEQSLQILKYTPINTATFSERPAPPAPSLTHLRIAATIMPAVASFAYLEHTRTSQNDSFFMDVKSVSWHARHA
jgi:hypothetical protein